MGIFVPNSVSVTLPDGNVVSNVYMTFCPETIHCFTRRGTTYEYMSRYQVFKDVYQHPWFAQFELCAETSDPSTAPPFTFMYSELKKLYPGAIDDLSPKGNVEVITPPDPASTPE